MTSPVRTEHDHETTYSQVLVPLDFCPASWQALSLATTVAHAFSVPRRVLHVDTASPWRSEEASPLLLSAAPGGEPIDVEVLSAPTPAAGIVSAATDEPSLVVMAAHTSAVAGERPLGTTTYDVLRTLPGPLLVAGPRFTAMRPIVTRIVLCVDLTAPPPDDLVGDVAMWARSMSVPAVVLAVTNHSTLSDFGVIYDERLRLQALSDAVADGGNDVSVVTREGERVASEIIDFVDELPGTIVALAAHARQLPARVLLGSVTTAVLRHAVSPVLLRRADG